MEPSELLVAASNYYSFVVEGLEESRPTLPVLPEDRPTAPLLPTTDSEVAGVKEPEPSVKVERMMEEIETLRYLLSKMLKNPSAYHYDLMHLFRLVSEHNKPTV